MAYVAKIPYFSLIHPKEKFIYISKQKYRRIPGREKKQWAACYPSLENPRYSNGNTVFGCAKRIHSVWLCSLPLDRIAKPTGCPSGAKLILM